MDTKKSWEFADEYVRDLEKRMEAEYKEYKYPAMVGALQALLGSIFIEFNVYHPETFKMVLERMELTV